jgi:hypothetical protein
MLPQLSHDRKQSLMELGRWAINTGRIPLLHDILQALRGQHYVAEVLRCDVCWVVADTLDALLLETYGFPAVAIEDRCHLAMDDLGGATWLIILRRPGEEATLSGLAIADELARIGWSGRLTTVRLPGFADLAEVEAECGADRFGGYLLALLVDAPCTTMTPRTTPRPFRMIEAEAMLEYGPTGHRRPFPTIDAAEVRQWPA